MCDFIINRKTIHLNREDPEDAQTANTADFSQKKKAQKPAKKKVKKGKKGLKPYVSNVIRSRSGKASALSHSL